MTLPYECLILEDLPNEIWRDVKQYEGYYLVSNLGRVKSTDKVGVGSKFNILKQYENDNGYLIVTLYKNFISKKVRVHRMVAMAFIENPFNKKDVNHKNGVKTDNRAMVLEWATRSENLIHAYKNKLSKPAWLGKKGSDNPCSKKVGQYTKDGVFVAAYAGAREAYEMTGITFKHISCVCHGRRLSTGGYVWKFL